MPLKKCLFIKKTQQNTQKTKSKHNSKLQTSSFSRLVFPFSLIDINRSLQASRRLVSATATAFSFDSFSSFRRTRGARQRIASSKSPASPSPLRNPSDGFNFDVQLTQKAPHLGRRRRRLQRWWSSTLSSRSFLRRRGRKPLARFPSGDWVISEHPVTPQDLKLAVSNSLTKLIHCLNDNVFNYRLVITGRELTHLCIV
ncbi:unnamed protein product [Brassica oleracea]